MNTRANVTDFQSILLECYRNGRFELLPLETAHLLLWTAGFAWISFARWIRYGWDRHSYTGPVPPHVEDTGLLFGFGLLTLEEPLTREELDRLDKRLRDCESDILTAYAYRFRLILPEDVRRTGPLFRSVKVLNRFGQRVSAYERVAECSTFLIAGLAGESAVPDRGALIRVLTTPPSGQAEGAAA